MNETTLKVLLPSEMSPPLKPFLVTDLEGLSLCAAFLERTEVFGFDIETNVTNNFTERRIRTMQFGNRDEQYVIDLLAFAGTKERLIAAQGPNPTNDSLQPVIQALKPYLESKSKTKVGAQLQFEYEVDRYNLGLRCTGFFDVWRAEQQLYAGLVHRMITGFWGLENIVARYTGLAMQDTTSGTTFDLETPLTDKQIIYAALDVRLPCAVRIGQIKKIAEAKLVDSCQIDFNAIPAFGDMFLNGVQTDDPQWIALIEANVEKKLTLLRKLDEKFIPVVGTKYITAAEEDHLIGLEEEWRKTPQKTQEEKAARALCRTAYMKYRTGLNERRKIAEKCEGEAAIAYGSPQKLLAAFRKLGFSATKMPDTSDETLEKLSKYPNLTVEKAFVAGDELNLPVVDLLRLFRSVDKQLSTYGYAWIRNWDEVVGENGHGHRNPVTGRIHSNIDMFGTDTGRTSSSKPNIQNIPKEKRFRRCFTARPGYKVLTIDYSGCELRILAEMSKEPIWLEAFLKGWDVHSVGAEILFGQEWKDGAIHTPYTVEVDGKLETIPLCAYYYKNAKGLDHDKCKCPIHEELRGRVKALNFGLAYGLSASGLSKQLNITYEAAGALLNLYKATFPTVMNFLEELGTAAKTRLEARTIIGTRRRWKKPSWELAMKRAAEDEKARAKKKSETPKPITDRDIRRKYTGMFGSIEREGKNAPIQGTNANLAKLAMGMVWERLEPEFGGLWLNMVHDELVVEVPEANAEAAFKFVGDCMTAAGALWIKSLPMTWEGKIKDYWTK
jgi:DNA polymerase I-like protein with 3'-5' exonuclease and polymerase domains